VVSKVEEPEVLVETMADVVMAEDSAPAPLVPVAVVPVPVALEATLALPVEEDPLASGYLLSATFLQYSAPYAMT